MILLHGYVCVSVRECVCDLLVCRSGLVWWNCLLSCGFVQEMLPLSPMLDSCDLIPIRDAAGRMARQAGCGIHEGLIYVNLTL